jgi:hypothetical protein
MIAATLLCGVAMLTACGGDDDNGDPTAARTASGSATAGASTPGGDGDATATTEGEGDSTPAASGDWDETRAEAFLAEVLIEPADIPGVWSVQNETLQTNADAIQDDPKSSASVERCGRLLSRLVTNQPEDPVGLYISGQTVSYFSTVTVYATPAGAADCAAEAAARFQQPGELARAFGSVFVDPDAVVVTPVDYPTVGDGSAAFNLTGQINAAGTVVDLTILIVSFLEGNVTAVVGSAAAGAPSVDDLTPYVNLVEQRIASEQD